MSDQIRTLIDNSRLTSVQISVVAICFLLNMVDGMDVLAISFAAPDIADEWSISPQSLGVVFSAALVGMTVGAVFLSPFSDVVGRRKLILASLVLVSVGMVATAQANSVAALIFLRFLAGLGIGSLLSSMTSMVSEYAPDRWRNLFILVLHAGYPIGAIIAGFAAAEILPLFGWRPLFVFAGLVSFAALPLVFLLLPESLEFLAKKQPRGALQKINAVLRRMGATPMAALPAEIVAAKSRISVTSLLREPFRLATIKLWLAFFMAFAALYFLLSWVVKLAIESGLALENAIYAGVCLNLGAFFGSISLGALSNRFGLTRVIALFFVAGAISIVVYGSAKVSVAIVLVLVFILMYFVQGAFTGLYAVAARIYPTEIRTTGIGWAIGAGRLGAILGPVTAGLVLGAGLSIAWTFALFAIPMIFAAAFVSRIRLPAQ
ncbi:MAG: MFS transporter [Gammaproteobacteria bacterium]|nr:MFS transporter [Gammaproteobacteria bacterium]